jgi:hypothetical protein
LPQYESTLDVGGQPVWLVPDTYASPKYKQVPDKYKLAHSKDDTLEVSVYDTSGAMLEKSHILKRDPDKIAETIESGHILTHQGYESNWYAFEQVEDWMNTYWAGLPHYHIHTRDIDAENAEAGQWAVLDSSNQLSSMMK